MPRLRKKTGTKATQLLRKGIKSPFPSQVEPMLATKIAVPFNDPGWLYEIKWDGYRIIAHIQRSKVVLHSRGLQNYTEWYPPIAEELATFKDDLILDGEVVVLNDEGISDFDALQNYKKGDRIVYYVFDILWYNGFNLLNIPLEDRKTILQSILPATDLIRYSEHFDNGVGLFEKIESLGMEGIVCKKRNSEYSPGERTKDWLKLPTVIRQEFVIGGWTESGSGRAFRSLLFGAYQNGKLINVGHAGGGYTNKNMKEILAQLKKIETRKNPFTNKVDAHTNPHWVKPILVAEFKYATFTRSGKIRKPAIFIAFRKDKDPKDVVLETVVEPKNLPFKQTRKVNVTAPGSNWPELEKRKITSRGEFKIDGYTIELTNVEQELWRNIAKAELIRYYNSVAPYILPHIHNRPQSLHVKYNGPHHKGLYIKDMEGRQPDCSEIFSVKRKHHRPGKNNVIDYLVCNNKATLLWMINLGCIDINPWTSRTQNYLYPDYIVIDLDPSDNDFSKAVETAIAAKHFLDEHQLKAFVKTSGKTGIHLFLPCTGFSFSNARAIAVNISKEIHTLVPDITTTEVSVSQRGTKLYIDPNQNDEADTVASAYSVRPFRLPTVSMPLEWKEVSQKLDPDQFTISTVLKRMQKMGDAWENLLEPKGAKANTKNLSQFF